MGNASQTGASISKITKASSLKDSPLERPPGDNSLKSHVEYEEKSSLKKKTKKRNKLKRKHDALILGPQDENCLQKDLETPQNNPAPGRKQRKSQKEKLNASENFNIHNDHEVGSVLVENPPLKSDLDVNSVQNNTILGAKKKKKRKKKKKHNALEINSSLQPPLNCLKMDTEMVDNSLKSDVEYEAKSCLKKEKKKRNKLKRKHDASILEAQVDYCLPKDLETAKQRKKRKNQKEKPNASGNCNIDNDHEEDSVLAENPSLKSDVDVESVQNNLTLGVKKKKKRKKKNKKHNALEDGSAHNDLEEGSLLVENLATLKRDVDMKTAQISQDMPDQSGTVKSLGDTAELVLSSALNTICQQSLTNLSGHVLKNADRLPQKVDGCSTSDSSFDQTSTTFPDKLPVSETRSEHLPLGNPLQPFAGPNLIREDFPSSSYIQGNVHTQMMPPSELYKSSSQKHPFSQQQPPPYSLQHSAADNVSVPLGLPGNTSSSNPRFPPDILERNQLSHLTDFPGSRIPTHYNPYASTFDQPLSSKFSSSAFRQEKDTPFSNKYDAPISLSNRPVNGLDAGSLGSRQMSSPNSVRAVRQILPRSGAGQYDPLFDSIEMSPNSFGKYDRVQKWDCTNDSDIMLRLSAAHKPLDVEENNKKEAGAVAAATSLDNDDYGETADAEVGTVENGSFSSPLDMENTAAGEIEIDQIKSPGKSKKSKDSRSMKLFKISLADFVKEVLKPSWRQGNMSKEAFKTIVKKTVAKVSGAMKGHQIPKSQAKINHYIDSSQRKLTKLVMGYVNKYVKV